MRRNLLTLSISLLLLFSCSSNDRVVSVPVTGADITRKIAAVNKELTIADMELIARYFQKREWPTQNTGSGLVYYIYKRGKGAPAVKESKVQISFTISLLNGTVCYGANKPVEKEFVVGMGKEISGLEEAILLLREGDQAIVAIPPHLGHGLLGDEGAIPARSTIIYDVTLEKVLQNK